MPKYELDGQVAIVTGAGRGIGRAIALRLAREEANVVVTDIDVANATKVAEEAAAFGKETLALQVDVTKKTDVERMVKETVARFGRIDILVNNAGVMALVPLVDADEETWQFVMDVNAKGVFLCSQAVARQMIAQKEGGCIINNASSLGKMAPSVGLPLGIYATSKHAVVGLTRAFAAELAPKGIRVNCVCGGIVDTPMWDMIDREVAKLEGGPVGSVKARFVSNIPLDRIQTPEDMANIVAYLASSDANYMTGQAVNYSGGRAP